MLLAALMAMSVDASAAEGAAGPAAPGTLEMFKALCIANEGRGADAIRRADAMKWSAPPTTAMTNLPPMIQQMQNLQVRMLRQPDNSGYVLMTATGADILSSGHPAPNAACMVMGIKPGAADQGIKADTAAWMGAQPVVVGQAMSIYAYTEKNGARSYMTKDQDSEVRQAFGSGKLKIVALDVESGANLMIYIVPTQAN
jgi:hypothetical protein